MTRQKVINSATSYLCKTCDDTDDQDDDFLWVVFEAIAHQAKAELYKELHEKDK